jgi:hypothetical protein
MCVRTMIVVSADMVAHDIHKQIFNAFSTNLHPISLKLNLKSIVKLNLIELKFAIPTI